MLKYVRTHSSVLTLLSLILGALLSPCFHKQPGYKSPVTVADFERQLEVYRSVPLLVTMPLNSGKEAARRGTRVSLEATHAELLVPDQLASKMYGCHFGGEMAPRYEAWVKTQADSDSLRDGVLRLRGDLYRCDSGSPKLIAKRVDVQIPWAARQADRLSIARLHAWASFPHFVAQMFITMLLMLFIPTLALSVLRSIVESAGSFRRLRLPFLYFVVTSVIAATLGVAVVRLMTGGGNGPTWAADLTGIAEKASSAADSMDMDKVSYEPHPVLNIIGSIIPKNPFGALTDPSGNAGLQLAFVCVVAGLLLSLLDDETRSKLSGFFNRMLAIVVHDKGYRNLAFSDLLDAITPFGMFFVTLSVGATLTLESLDRLWQLVMAILVALMAQVAVLLVWLFWRRDARNWASEVAVPSLPALLVAFTTASSYAALTALNKVEGIHRDPMRRGIIDLGTVLNKNGTAVYISTAAAFTLAAQSVTGAQFWGVIPFAALAAIATAGLPFAAVIGLRMVLLSVGFPGSLAWLILPIDPLIDRFVTVLNVLSNLILCSDSKSDSEAAPDLLTSSAAEAH